MKRTAANQRKATGTRAIFEYFQFNRTPGGPFWVEIRNIYELPIIRCRIRR